MDSKSICSARLAAVIAQLFCETAGAQVQYCKLRVCGVVTRQASMDRGDNGHLSFLANLCRHFALSSTDDDLLHRLYKLYAG